MTTVEGLEAWLDEARHQGFLAIDTETSSLNAAAAELVGVALATALERPVMFLSGTGCLGLIAASNKVLISAATCLKKHQNISLSR